MNQKSMNIEQFVTLSQGEWRSMRSGHSLAFKQFEEILSTIKIEIISTEDPTIKSMLKASKYRKSDSIMPFKISWSAESDWDINQDAKSNKGECYLIPIPNSSSEGKLIRSLGYAEKVASLAKYKFLNDGTFLLKTEYEHTFIEERIWFASSNVRCRSSIIFSLVEKSILQTSFSSEIKLIIN